MSESPTIARRVPRWISHVAAGLVVFGAIAAFTSLANTRVRGTPYPLDLAAAIRGAATTVDATLPAALKTWALLALVLFAFARRLRARAPSLRPSEAIAGAVVLLWSGAYGLLLTLGPTGAYQPWLLRLVTGAVVLWALLHRPAAGPRRRASPGIAIALLAFLLAFVPLLVMQLGSPVSPFMDVLPYVASTQKIVTFQFYDPFANDAAGHWAPTRQVVGCDAAFSFLALVTGQTAELAITSLILPVAALQLLAIYLLGRAVHGPVAGGMAALFLLQTFIWRRTPDVRGTALAFSLIAIGLAFMFSGRRDRGPRTALAGLAFGTSVVVNPLIGALGMQVASAATIVAFLDGVWPFWPPVLAMAGASIFALPQVTIGLSWDLPWAILPLTALAGALIIGVASRIGGGAPRSTRRRCILARSASLIAVVIAIFYRHAHRSTEFFPDTWLGYGPLVLLAMPGLAVLGTAIWRAPSRWPAAAIPALAILAGFLDHYIADPLRFQGTIEGRSLASEVTTKMLYYWWPYWCALLTGILFGALTRRTAFLPTLIMALALTIYPFHSPQHAVEFDTKQLSVAETWGHHLTHATRGYHGGRPDRRWVLDDRWREVRDFFLAEVAAGRIRYDTHVLHVSESINSLELALGTGISTDLITPQHDPGSIWTVGGRIRGVDAIPEAFAAAPPFVLLQRVPLPDPSVLDDYELVLVQAPLNLEVYRRLDSATAAESATD